MEIGRPHDACDLLARAAELADAPAERMAVHHELVRAAQVAERWALVVEAIATYRQIAAQAGQPIGRYDELTILELDARLWSGDEPQTLLEDYRGYLHDPEAPDDVRLRAANALMRMAEELLSVDLAEEAFDAARDIPEHPELEPERFRLRLMNALMSGRHDEAIAASRRAMAEIHGNAAVMCRTLWLCGFGLLRAGLLDAGCAALEAVHDRARGARLHSHEFSAALALACVLRDAGRTGDALAWHAKASLLAERSTSDRRSLNHFANCVLFALDRGDFAEARRSLARWREIPASKSGYPQLIFLALEIRMRQLEESYDSTDDELRDLLDGHFRARSLGHHDEVMVTLWHALARKGRVEYADELLRAYLEEFRQLRWPLCPELRQLAARVAGEPEESAVSAVA